MTEHACPECGLSCECGQGPGTQMACLHDCPQYNGDPPMADSTNTDSIGRKSVDALEQGAERLGRAVEPQDPEWSQIVYAKRISADPGVAALVEFAERCNCEAVFEGWVLENARAAIKRWTDG